MSADVEKLTKEFNGAIKYDPMIKDHPRWTHEECLAFAKKWHVVAMERFKKGDPQWNDRIPYCCNIPTPEMIKEAKI